MTNRMTIIAAVGLTLVSPLVQADTKTTYRDAHGRIQGTATTDRYGKTTYLDSMGRIQGTKK